MPRGRRFRTLLLIAASVLAVVALYTGACQESATQLSVPRPNEPGMGPSAQPLKRSADGDGPMDTPDTPGVGTMDTPDVKPTAPVERPSYPGVGGDVPCCPYGPIDEPEEGPEQPLEPIS